MANVKNYYKILGVDFEADDEDIKGAFMEQAKQFASPEEPGALLLREAYAVLNDPTKRMRYDSYLKDKLDDSSGGLVIEEDDDSPPPPPRPKKVARPKQTRSIDDEELKPHELALQRMYAPEGADYVPWEYITLRSSRNYGTTKFYLNGFNQTQWKNANFSDVLNQLGEHGWELLGISVVGNEQTFVFKRQGQ